jgi:hypothetical protein
MIPKRYTDPLGSRLPALEKNILKHRAMEMLLVLFYAEDLKRDVLDHIQATDTAPLSGGKQERVPKGIKNPVDKALNALIEDGAITLAQKKEIVGLIDYRNIIAHQMHNILADVSPEPIAREYTHYLPKRPKYDYDAVKRLQHYRKLFDGLYRTHCYVTTLNYDGLLFEVAERTFLEEIKRLRKIILRQVKERSEAIKRLNRELALKDSGLDGEYDPRHPLMQYDDRRFTKRGVEACFRLFDLGKSTMAVTHIMGLSLRATRKRQKQWNALGGKRRPRALPEKNDSGGIPLRARIGLRIVLEGRPV